MKAKGLLYSVPYNGHTVILMLRLMDKILHCLQYPELWGLLFLAPNAGLAASRTLPQKADTATLEQNPSKPLGNPQSLRKPQSPLAKNFQPP